MASTSEAPFGSPKFATGKRVIVRVKRKPSQSPLEAFWLEINERPSKRPLLDFEKLSINEASVDGSKVEELKTKKVLVQHVETRSDSDTSVVLLDSFASDSAGGIEDESKNEERKRMFKKDNKQEQLLSKARERQEELSKNARFEQIWRKRRGNEEASHDKELYERCHFYDVVRVDGAERSDEVRQEVTSLEDQQLLSSYLPLLREFIPSAASEIESEMHSYLSEQEEYVYDYYAARDHMDMGDKAASSPFPLVQVQDEEFCGEDVESEYDTEDSNDESHPRNEYPDESTEEEDEAESNSSIDELDELESDEASSRSSDIEDPKPGFSRDVSATYDDEIYGYLEDVDDFDHDEDNGAGDDHR